MNPFLIHYFFVFIRFAYVQCLDIIENMENVLMKIFQADKEPMQIENHVCALESSYCLAEDEYEQDNEILGDDERIYNEELWWEECVCLDVYIERKQEKMLKY